jgi:hypothetical protein
MKRQRLNKLSLAERAKLTRQLKDAMDAGLIRPNYSESDSLILLWERLMAHFVCVSTIVALTRLRVRTLTRFRVWATLLTNLRTRTFTHTSTSRLALGEFE